MAETDQANLDDRLQGIETVNEQLRVGTQLGRQFSNSLVNAFEGIAIKGKSLGDVMKGLTLSLSRMVVQAAFKPLEGAVGQGLASMFSGGFGFAKGAAFQQGMPVPFAKGGVISSPMTFPLGNGGTGLAGEAGSEAILPLARGWDGRLGVSARGGGTNVTVNISTPDLESFRRSESQLAAILARTVSSGQRNL